MADGERFVRVKSTARLFEHAGHIGITGKWFTPASGRTVPVRKAADEAPHWVTIDGNPVLIGAGKPAQALQQGVSFVRICTGSR